MLLRLKVWFQEPTKLADQGEKDGRSSQRLVCMTKYIYQLAKFFNLSIVTVVTDKSVADQLLETQRMNFVHLVDI